MNPWIHVTSFLSLSCLFKLYLQRLTVKAKQVLAGGIHYDGKIKAIRSDEKIVPGESETWDKYPVEIPSEMRPCALKGCTIMEFNYFIDVSMILLVSRYTSTCRILKTDKCIWL